MKQKNNLKHLISIYIYFQLTVQISERNLCIMLLYVWELNELQFSETQCRQKLKFRHLVLKHSADPEHPETFEIVNYSTTFFFISCLGVTSQPSLIYFLYPVLWSKCATSQKRKLWTSENPVCWRRNSDPITHFISTLFNPSVPESIQIKTRPRWKEFWLLCSIFLQSFPTLLTTSTLSRIKLMRMNELTEQMYHKHYVL